MFYVCRVHWSGVRGVESHWGYPGVPFGHPVPFITLEEEPQHLGWVGNVAVIETLREENIQPISFAPAARTRMSYPIHK